MSLSDTPEVVAAVQKFVDMANAHPSMPESYAFRIERLAKRYRIVMEYKGTGASVHAFVDLATGDLLKAAGWAAPAKGVRFNLLTQFDEVEAKFDWAGGYLYVRR